MAVQGGSRGMHEQAVKPWVSTEHEEKSLGKSMHNLGHSMKNVLGESIKRTSLVQHMMNNSSRTEHEEQDLGLSVPNKASGPGVQTASLEQTVKKQALGQSVSKTLDDGALGHNFWN